MCTHRCRWLKSVSFSGCEGSCGVRIQDLIVCILLSCMVAMTSCSQVSSLCCDGGGSGGICSAGMSSVYIFHSLYSLSDAESYSSVLANNCSELMMAVGSIVASSCCNVRILLLIWLRWRASLWRWRIFLRNFLVLLLISSGGTRCDAWWHSVH